MDNRRPMPRPDLNVNISRRQFMKYTGTIVFTLGSGRYAFAGQVPSKGINARIPPSDGYLLVDINKCQGCTSCMLACTLVH